MRKQKILFPPTPPVIEICQHISLYTPLSGSQAAQSRITTAAITVSVATTITTSTTTTNTTTTTLLLLLLAAALVVLLTLTQI